MMQESGRPGIKYAREHFIIYNLDDALWALGAMGFENSKAAIVPYGKSTLFIYTGRVDKEITHNPRLVRPEKPEEISELLYRIFKNFLQEKEHLFGRKPMPDSLISVKEIKTSSYTDSPRPGYRVSMYLHIENDHASSLEKAVNKHFDNKEKVGNVWSCED